MSEPDFNPQTPGENPSVDQDRIAALAGGTVDEVLELLDGLSTEDLEQLAVVEAKGKNRTTLLGAIAREVERREVGDAPDAPEPKVHALGDLTDYASMRGKDVDPATLERPVLTLDGWVLPVPRSEG